MSKPSNLEDYKIHLRIKGCMDGISTLSNDYDDGKLPKMSEEDHQKLRDAYNVLYDLATKGHV